MTSRAIDVAGLRLGEGPLFFLCGPCVLEERQKTLDIAGTLRDAMVDRGLPFLFKASFDKANRSSLGGGRGPGMDEGLGWLGDVREAIGVPVVTDVHLPDQCAAVAEVADVLVISRTVDEQPAHRHCLLQTLRDVAEDDLDAQRQRLHDDAPEALGG